LDLVVVVGAGLGMFCGFDGVDDRLRVIIFVLVGSRLRFDGRFGE
jgi:hypothetical protein